MAQITGDSSLLTTRHHTVAVRHFSAMRVSLAAILACALPLLSACTGQQSERCKQVCQQETECAASRNVKEEDSPYDLDECVAACINLERDIASRHIVEEHVECAKKAAGSCEALKACR